MIRKSNSQNFGYKNKKLLSWAKNIKEVEKTAKDLKCDGIICDVTNIEQVQKCI